MNYQASPEVDEFLSRLRGVKKSGSNWVACCPCRDDDDNPSLSIGQGRDGKVLATCHRGAGACDFAGIMKAVGMKTKPKEETPVRLEKEVLKWVANYDYYDGDGTLLFQKQRFVTPDGKKRFRQRKPDGNGGWDYSLGDTPRVLYNLPAVTEAVKNGGRVYVVEGEKDADSLIALGYTATTCPNGAGSWMNLHTNALVGATVEVIADNDEPGLEHAYDVKEHLVEAGVKVRIWRTPEGKDVTDFLDAGGNLKSVIRVDAPTVPDVFDVALKQIATVFDDGDLTASQKVNRATMLLTGLVAEETADEGRLTTWTHLMSEQDKDTYDWVIPGILERQERVIVVAAEGVGKSTLARQVAILCSYGIQPFSFSAMKPARTLYVDLENPERIIRRNSRPIIDKARLYTNHTPEAHILIKPAGFDLLKQQDRAILEKHIRAVQPDILFMGPLYKAFVDGGGRTPEAIAVEVVKYLDYIRDSYGCALWLEHHAPLGNSMATRELRPFGSAVWSRWPEFGLALVPDLTMDDGYFYKLEHFRGEREPRNWPLIMKRGTAFPFETVQFRKT